MGQNLTEKGGVDPLKASRLYRYGGIVVGIAAAVLGGWAVYQARKTEPVLVAAKSIAPYTFVTPNDFVIRDLPVAAVASDALHSTLWVEHRMTTMALLPGEQVRSAIFDDNTNVQSLVNATTGEGDVVAPVRYKVGALEEYIPAGTTVDLSGVVGQAVVSCQVFVLQNTGYESVLGVPTKNASPMLLVRMPRTTYVQLFSDLNGHNVSVALIEQGEGHASSPIPSQGSQGSQGNVASKAQRTKTSHSTPERKVDHERTHPSRSSRGN
ncbi:MAG: SAF domain-containing protein [Sulfobacillus thermotolerans]|nr:SAF domain-containing protein [Sulfobacillus thermotolerans]